MTSAPIPSQNAVTGSSGTHPVPEGAADNAPPANSGVLTTEDIYANAYTTMIAFRDELTEQQIKFICDQISRKVSLALSSAQCATPIDHELADNTRKTTIEECCEIVQACDSGRGNEKFILESIRALAVSSTNQGAGDGKA